MRKTLPVLFLFLFIPAIFFGEDKDYFSDIGVTKVERDIDAVDFSIKSLSGKQYNLSDFKGKVVLLNFWATWCGPCKSEVNDIDTLYRTLKDENFTVMALDIREKGKVIRKFMNKNEIDFPVYLDDTGNIASQYGVNGIPTTFIIDPDGKVVGWAVGPRRWGSVSSVALMRSLMK